MLKKTICGWVTDNDLITGQAVNSDGAPMDYREFHRYLPLLIGAIRLCS